MLAETCRDWPRLAETGCRDWPRLAETGRGLQRLAAETCRDLQRLAETGCRDLQRLAETGCRDWLQRLGCRDLAAETWLQRLGCRDLAAETWLQRLSGCRDWLWVYGKQIKFIICICRRASTCHIFLLYECNLRFCTSRAYFDTCLAHLISSILFLRPQRYLLSLICWTRTSASRFQVCLVPFALSS
jgi:hypothetical protein